jgi:ABC-type polysaccharide/polyol phosphate transport system ATPase subunit
MSSEALIRARDLGKSYQIFARPWDRLGHLFFGRRRGLRREIDAVRGVSFSVGRGETVGVVGQNGSGKSTLLQLVAGTLRPTTGVCEVQGRVAAILDLGAGFNLDFTGGENIFMNATILGLTTEEIAERYDDIVDFAGIGDFVDQPVKTYSSGMYLRLAFAIAVSVRPDVLLVDEVLAVGDARFQAKCLERMHTIQREGTTILFVSHAAELVRRFCNRCLWLEAGRLILDGDAAAVTDRYLDFVKSLDGNGAGPKPAATIFPGQVTLARLRSVEMSADSVDIHDTLRVTIDYEILDDGLRNFLLGVAIYTLNRNYVFGPNTALDDVSIPTTPGRHRVSYCIPRVPLLGGSYLVDVGLFLDRGLVCLDYRVEAGRFVVRAPYVAEGLVHIDHRWEVRE